MKNTLRAGLMAAIVGLTGACSGTGDGTASQNSPSPQKAQPHVWSSQVQAVDKAKGAEDTVLESARRQQQEIERQEK